MNINTYKRQLLNHLLPGATSLSCSLIRSFAYVCKTCVTVGLSNVIEDAGVGGWVGARGAANWSLVNVNYLVELLEALDP